MAEIGALVTNPLISSTQHNSNDQNNSRSSDYDNTPLADLNKKALGGDQQSLDAIAALIYALQNTLSNPSSSTTVDVSRAAANDPSMANATTADSSALGSSNPVNGSIRATDTNLNVAQMPMQSARNNYGNGAANSANGSSTSGIGGISNRAKPASDSSGNISRGSNNQSDFNTDSVFNRSDNVFGQVARLLEEQERIGRRSAEFTASSGALSSALQALQAVSRNIRA